MSALAEVQTQRTSWRSHVARLRLDGDPVQPGLLLRAEQLAAKRRPRDARQRRRPPKLLGLGPSLAELVVERAAVGTRDQSQAPAPNRRD